MTEQGRLIGSVPVTLLMRDDLIRTWAWAMVFNALILGGFALWFSPVAVAPPAFRPLLYAFAVGGLGYALFAVTAFMRVGAVAPWYLLWCAAHSSATLLAAAYMLYLDSSTWFLALILILFQSRDLSRASRAFRTYREAGRNHVPIYDMDDPQEDDDPDRHWDDDVEIEPPRA